MSISFKIVLINFIPSNLVRERVEEKIISLNRIAKNISSCKITIESYCGIDKIKVFYDIKINLTLEDNVVITNRYSNLLIKYEDINVAVWRAFISLRQQLENFYNLQHHSFKKLTVQSYGCALKLNQINNIFPLKPSSQYH